MAQQQTNELDLTRIADAILTIEDKDGFSHFVTSVRESPGYTDPAAFAFGLAHIAESGAVLSVRFPFVNVGKNFGSAALFRAVTGGTACASVREAYPDAEQIDLIDIAFSVFEGDGGIHGNIDAFKAVVAMSRSMCPLDGSVRPVIVFINDLQQPPYSAAEAYLRLHLLSHRAVLPNSINLDGLFGILTNCAWTTEEGPIEYARFDHFNQQYMVHNGVPLTVRQVDKFPPMLEYVVPSGVRVLGYVRLGAYLASGTVVMPAGFVNFNAGTLPGPKGRVMVEGRISAGVTVADDSDLGGGCSTMGTLSGGGKAKISVGSRCLIGANAGIGISLGDDCKVEAGLYVTAGSEVRIYRGSIAGLAAGFPTNQDLDSLFKFVGEKLAAFDYTDLHQQEKFELEISGDKTNVTIWMKALHLSGHSGLTFRRNSRDGVVEVVPTKGVVVLNEALHKN